MRPEVCERVWAISLTRSSHRVRGFVIYIISPLTNVNHEIIDIMTSALSRSEFYFLYTISFHRVAVTCELFICFPLANSRSVWQVQVQRRFLYTVELHSCAYSHRIFFFFSLASTHTDFSSQFTTHENSQYLAKVKIARDEKKQKAAVAKRDLTGERQKARRRGVKNCSLSFVYK